MVYECTKCGHNTTHKGNMIKHINRKKSCKSINNINPNFISIPDIICEICKKKFSTKYTLKRHQTKCKNNTNNEKTLEKLVKLLNDKNNTQQEEISVLMKKVNVQNITNNSTTNIINININVLPYDKPDMSHLTKEKLMEYLSGDPKELIPKLIKEIHCNPNKPENHSLYITNNRNDKIMAWNGKEIILEAKDKIIQDTIDRGSDHLEDWAINNQDIDSTVKEVYENYVEERGEDGVEDDIETIVKMNFYNSRKMVQETIKKQKPKIKF